MGNRGSRVDLRKLPVPLREAIREARRIARERGTSLHLVGGAVRDLLLSRPVTDLDLVVDADAGAFARELAARLGAPLRRHERFGTATLRLPGGEEIDVATRRRERYARPGALPSVEPGTLEEDLARRDFTVNAMALDLQAQPPSLVDPIGGARDLESRRLRLIHPGSARDDPTRGLRAARYANRLGFRIEAQSARWIREAAAQGALRTISADRLRRELEKIFEEPRAGGALRLLEGLGLLRAIHPALRGDAAARRRADAAAGIARRMGAPLAASVVRALALELSRPALAELAGRLGFTGEGASRLEGWPARLRQLGRPSRLAPSKVDRWIGEALPEEIAAAAASLPAKDRLAMMRAQRLRATMKARVTGGEIVGAGVPPGPWIAGALAAARAARLDGRIVPGKEKAYAIATARRRAARRG